MTVTLEAPQSARDRFQEMRSQGAQAFLRAAKAGEVTQRLPKRRKAVRGLPVALQAERLGDPTPERSEKAIEVTADEDGNPIVETALMRSGSPPFNTQILGPYHRYARQLGQETVDLLDLLYGMGEAANPMRRIVSTYSGVSVDSSASGYQHLTDRERETHQKFHRLWQSLGPDFRRLAADLVFETTALGHERGRTLLDIGFELTGSIDQRRSIGGVVTAMRLLSWRVGEILGGSSGKRKTVPVSKLHQGVRVQGRSGDA